MKSANSGRTGAWLAALAASALAITNIAAPIVYQAGSNPATVLMLRALATVLAIGTILVLSGRLQRLTAKQERDCLISGLLFMFAGIGLMNALAIAPVSMVVLILYLFPILTTLLDGLVHRRSPGLTTIGLLLVALFGLGLALEANVETVSPAGMALAFLAAISSAATLVWNNYTLEDVDPEQITFRMFCVSLAVFGTYVLLNGNFALPGGGTNMTILGLMLVCFAVAFLTLFRGVQMAGSVRAAMILNLEPAISIILSVVILAEAINLRQAFGMAIVLAAIVVSQLLTQKTNNNLN